jgi:hypothetical protein
MNLNNTKTEEKKAMRKQFGSIAAIMLAVLVLIGGTTPVRSQGIFNFIPYPTLSLRNFHVPSGDGLMRVPVPGNGGERYFLVPVWIWNQVDTTKNPNNSWYTDGRTGNPGQHLEPIRSFNFQLWYNNEAMQLDTLHGSPIVMTGPSIVATAQGGCSVTPHPDTALASNFFVTFTDQSNNDPSNPFSHVIRLAGASSVPLPMNASSDTGYREHNGILFWLRFQMIVTFAPGGLMVLDSAQFNDHWGDTDYSQPGSNFTQYPLLNRQVGPSETVGNFGGGLSQGGVNARGQLNISYVAQPVLELRPLPNIAISPANTYPNQYDSLFNDLVYDPTVFNGAVAQAIILDDATSGTEMDNVSINSNQPWLTINCGTSPGGGTTSLFLGQDGVDELNNGSPLEGPAAVTMWLTVSQAQAQAMAPGIYYATVTFTNDQSSNSPLPLIVRFVREAAPDEPQPGGTGIQLQISNACANSVTNYLTFGTGPGATDSIDPIFGEQAVTVGDSISAFLADSQFSYFVPNDPNLIAALGNIPGFVGYTRDIRDSSTDTSLIYQVRFNVNSGSTDCYPVKVCVDPTLFPAGSRVVFKYTLNGSDEGIDLRNATQSNGLECVTINDQKINTFYIVYTPGTIANEATFIKQNSWSLVSLPVIPPNPDAGVIFSNALTVPYQYQSSSGWEQQSTLEFGRGYMVRYGTYIGTDVTVAGIKSYSVTNVQIAEGWNSLGGTSSPGTFDGSDGTIITPTQLPGGQIPRLLSYMWEFTPQSGYDMTNFFIPGRGYFIKSDNPGFWNIQTPTPGEIVQSHLPAGKATIDRENLQGELTQTLVTDADGNGQALYFGNATTDQPESNFEMPGKFNSFDARFDANSGMVSFNHASYVVNIHATSYPLTMKFTNASGPVTVSDMNGNVIGTTTNNGIVTISNPGITQVQIAEKQGDAPSVVGYALQANTPNPFSQTSTINYSLPQESVVSLVVYNQLGEVVQTLVNSVVGAGEHQALFDGSQLPAGTYYYTLKAGNFVQTQSMTLER